MTARLRSRIASVSLQWFAENAAAKPLRYFSGSEWTAVRGLPRRSAAGLLAVKYAVAGLLKETGYAARSGPRSVAVSYVKNGPPVLRRPASAVGRLALSVTHTGRTAFGLAALMESDGGNDA